MKKAIVLLSAIFAMTVSPIQTVQANLSNGILRDSSVAIRMQRADVIVKRIRVNNGVLQYRRWNETQGCWVDLDWIDFS